MTPNPTTATRSQAMRHIVGAPALPYEQLLQEAVTGGGVGRERRGAVTG